MTNAYNRFQTLVGTDSIDVVTIVTVGSGTSIATTLSGATVTVKGISVSAGNKAFVRNSEIIRQAPNHAIVQINV